MSDLENKKSPVVITIARDFGAEGHEIGRILANELGIPLYAKPAVDPVYLLYGAGFGHCDFDHRLYAVYQRCYG